MCLFLFLKLPADVANHRHYHARDVCVEVYCGYVCMCVCVGVWCLYLFVCVCLCLCSCLCGGHETLMALPDMRNSVYPSHHVLTQPGMGLSMSDCASPKVYCSYIDFHFKSAMLVLISWRWMGVFNWLTFHGNGLISQFNKSVCIARTWVDLSGFFFFVFFP